VWKFHLELHAMEQWKLGLMSCLLLRVFVLVTSVAGLFLKLCNLHVSHFWPHHFVLHTLHVSSKQIKHFCVCVCVRVCSENSVLLLPQFVSEVVN
jgi:hypothetical protein